MTIDKARVEQIRKVYADQRWPCFAYFVHGEAREHIADLLAYIDQQAVPPDATETIEQLQQTLSSKIDALFSRETEVQAKRIEALEGALKPFVESAPHTRIFLTSREKMLQTGVYFFDEDVARARAALASGKEG